ncbi:sensor histidine kinase [Bacillus sp. T33-2]|nr:sensor histidine kinase [Bacillus sp. T33-2]
MFTFGISGILTLFAFGSDYVHRDYFHTPAFQSEIEQFAHYVGMFELNDLTLEEAKRAITVTEEDINEHRFRYGDLNTQITNIKNQYEPQIQQAKATDNQEAADAFTQERDAKIEDITNNFKNDEHVRPKVIKEKEQRIEDYYRERENYRPEFLRYKDSFQYHFKNSATGKVYTNVDRSKDDSAGTFINGKNMLFYQHFSIPTDFLMNNGYGFVGSEEIKDALVSEIKGTFEGRIGVAKSMPQPSWITDAHQNYKQEQLILLAYTVASAGALILFYFLMKKSKAVPAVIENVRPYYNRLPFDSRLVLFLLISIGAVACLMMVTVRFHSINNNPVVFGTVMFIVLAISSIFCGLALLQGRLLAPEFKSWRNIKSQWQKGLWNKAWQSVKESFFNLSVGTQLIAVFALVFGLGLTAAMIMLDPIFLFLFIVLLALLGIPLAVFMVKQVSYFNRIMQKTDELAAGNLGPDLPVTGKSVLAKHAGKINVLKQGMKVSQKEQAKSERLKTELITNVSHDLRTPLTSIITYTELLKTIDLSEDDRKAYLEIIDRKSKRLKMLIEDLFEVSKMASGNIQMAKEKIDLVQLLQQALAEHDNTISTSTLHFRVANPEKPVYAIVDGQKLWRVFDNLIGNILKYSLENSRVYISVKTLDDQALITFKNVSKYELSENLGELFERFKRGDESRHTEGSGLGLAIAKSIVDLHDGSLDIEADGDLFKVSIVLQAEDE